MPWLSRTAKGIAARFIWGNPTRSAQTLLRFARTEAGGAEDIRRAARASTGPELRKHFTRHAEDERRHAELFRARALEVMVAPEAEPVMPEATGADLLPASTTERGSLGLTDHGFLPSDGFATLGELPYVAMLHLAEVQAAEDFAAHHRRARHTDPRTAAIFEEILGDEAYHVAYTRTQLKSWETAGRGDEVRRALRSMRRSRWKAQSIQFARIFGDVMSGLMLRILYVTIFLPFGLLGRLARARRGWVAPSRGAASGLAELRTA